LFVSSGAFVRTQSEAELAELLAHAIAHLELWRENATIPLIWMDRCTRSGGRILPKHLSNVEAEADQLASAHLLAAGYAPGDFVDAFTTSQYQEVKARLAAATAQPPVRKILPTLERP
jgi:predicted Zn-dependent protease